MFRSVPPFSTLGSEGGSTLGMGKSGTDTPLVVGGFPEREATFLPPSVVVRENKEGEGAVSVGARRSRKEEGRRNMIRRQDAAKKNEVEGW